MQNFLSSEKKNSSGDQSNPWGYIGSVRLTKVDELQQYAHDSLATSLENLDSGRHVARVAHLYFARTSNLTQADLEVHLLALIKKIYGPSPIIQGEWGWMGSTSLNDLPKSIWAELRRDHDSTFDEHKWSSEHLKAFRVFQLLHPKVPDNLFQVVYSRSNTQFLYLFPTSDLPPRTELLLNVWRSGQTQLFVPTLYVDICGDPPRLTEGYLQLFLPDWFTLRLLNWYVGSVSKPTQSAANQNVILNDPLETGKGNRKKIMFSSMSIASMTACNPPFELLMAYLEEMLPHQQQAKIGAIMLRTSAIFRWALADLWLNRIKLVPSDPDVAQPTLRLLQSIFLLISHFICDPLLVVDDDTGSGVYRMSSAFATYRAPLSRFFMYALGECPLDSEASFDLVVDLVSVYLAPWRTVARQQRNGKDEGPLDRLVHFPASSTKSDGKSGGNAQFGDNWVWFIVHNYCAYVDLLHKALLRLDQEANPTLDALEAVCRLFVNPDAVYCSAALGALHACEKLWNGSRESYVPEYIENSRDAMRTFQMVMDQSSAVLESIRLQHEELGYQPDAQGKYGNKFLLSPVATHIRSFARELLHKRRGHGSHAGLSGLALPIHHQSRPGDVDQICKIFGVDVSSLLDEQVGSKRTDTLFKAPDMEEKVGVPKWLNIASSAAHHLRFRGLTESGRRQIRNGLCEGGSSEVVYVGDYSRRPVNDYEVPLLVLLAINISIMVEKLVSMRIDIRPLADARSILWLLLVFEIVDLIKLGASYSLWITSFVIYTIGASNLRGPSASLWNAIFALVWVYGIWYTD